MLEAPELIEDTRFVTNSLRYRNRAAVDATVNGVSAALSSDALIARLEAAGTAWARLNGVDGLSAHSQLRRVEEATPSGPAAVPALPIRWGEAAAALPVPALRGGDKAIWAAFA